MSGLLLANRNFLSRRSRCHETVAGRFGVDGLKICRWALCVQSDCQPGAESGAMREGSKVKKW